MPKGPEYAVLYADGRFHKKVKFGDLLSNFIGSIITNKKMNFLKCFERRCGDGSD